MSEHQLATGSPTEVGASVSITNAKVSKPDHVGVHLSAGWIGPSPSEPTP